MAIDNKKKIQTVGMGHVFVSGSFYPNGSSAVTSVTGFVASVSYSQTGTFIIAMPKTGLPPQADFTFQNHSFTKSDVRLEGGAYDPVAGTKVVRVLNISTTNAQNIAANSGNAISFMVNFKQTDVPGN